MIPSEMVAATSSPVPIVVAEPASADNPAEKGDKSTDPSSFLDAHKPVEFLGDAFSESFTKYFDDSFDEFLSNPSILAPSLLIEVGLHRGVDLTPADGSQLYSPKLVGAVAENYWKLERDDPEYGAMKFLMRSLILPRKWDSVIGVQ